VLAGGSGETGRSMSDAIKESVTAIEADAVIEPEVRSSSHIRTKNTPRPGTASMAFQTKSQTTQPFLGYVILQMEHKQYFKMPTLCHCSVFIRAPVLNCTRGCLVY
jgi:hypothetical protein